MRLKLTLPECGSTNELMQEYLRKNPLLEVGSYIRALHQTAGRGRSGNEWWNPEKGLMMSVFVPMRGAPAERALLPLLCGAAIHEIFQEKFPVQAGLTLKWPNDLYFNDQKIMGLLCESSQNQTLAILGMGLNFRSGDQLSKKGGISGIEAWAGRDLGDPAEWIEILIENVLRWTKIPTPLAQLQKYFIKAGTFRFGDDLEWRAEGKTIEGRYTGLGPYGELCAEREGQIVRLVSNEVQKVRRSIGTG